MDMQQLLVGMSPLSITISLRMLKVGVGVWVVVLMIMRNLLGDWILGIMLFIILVSTRPTELNLLCRFGGDYNANTVLGSRVTDGGAMEVNFVGNLYKQGPASELTYALQATVSSTP